MSWLSFGAGFVSGLVVLLLVSLIAAALVTVERPR